MIMGYEKPVEMPTMDIYNTDLMKAYIAGVKDQYDKALDEMKDFMKTYNDFYSPIEGDTQAYHDMTVGGASNLINNLYAHGIDPFKSPEARAAISRYINSVPTGRLGQMKQSAEAAQEYIKNRGKMQAAGTWNPEYERWLLRGRSLEDWDTSTDGVWNRTAPGLYQDIHSFTDDWFKHLEPKFNEALTKQKNDGYRYFTTSEDDLRNVISGRLDDIIHDGGIGQYNYERMLQVANGDENTARELLTREIVSRNSDYLRIKPETDQYALDRFRTNNDIRAHAANAATDHNYWLKQHPEYDPKSPFYGVGITKPKAGSNKGAAIDNGEYSHYAAISQATYTNIDDKFKNAVAARNTENTPNVKVVAMKQNDGTYKKVALAKVSGNDELKNLKKNGIKLYKGKDGTYRALTDAEKQQQVLLDAKRKGKNMWDTIRVKDDYKDAPENTGAPLKDSSDKGAIQLTSWDKDEIFFEDEVFGNAYGMRDSVKVIRQKEAKNALFKYLKEHPESVDKIGVKNMKHAGDVYLNSNRIGKYEEFEITGVKYNENAKKWESNSKGRYRILHKIGQYDHNYNVDSRWAPRMVALDHRQSANAMGANNAVTTTNVINQ